MYAVADLPTVLPLIINHPTEPVAVERIVVVEEHPHYPGELAFQVFSDATGFYSRYRDWLSVYCVLNELFTLPRFVEQLSKDGWEVVFGTSAEAVLVDMMRWRLPLEIEGYDLHDYQQFALRRAFEQDFWFFNWATGAGKSFVAGAGAKELFRRGEIDLVIATTMSESKIDLCRFLEAAGLDAVVNDGDKRKRKRVYAQSHQAYVMNYEKLWVDWGEIREVVTGKRVLWVFDECHRLLSSLDNDATYNKARHAFGGHLLMCAKGTKVWAMSASTVDGNPRRFHDVFELAGHNPLGTKDEFTDRYADAIKTIPLKRPRGRTYDLTVYDWNLTRLQEVRHRVGGYTQAVRKTDPGVAHLFKGLQTITEMLVASPREQALSEVIVDRAWDDYRRDPEIDLAPYYTMLRYVANTPLALRHTNFDVGRQIAAQHSELIDKIVNTKMAKLNEHLEIIRQGGDKVLVFTHWTTLGLLLLAPSLSVPHVVHYGAGQHSRDSQEARDRFKSDPDITCFFTSDAGSHGLNMQCARYVIQLEPTYSWDLAMQRASRIDRADSHLDGLTNYVYCIQDSVEERVLYNQTQRRKITEAIQGTTEALSAVDARAHLSEADNYHWLIFGSKER